MTMTRGCNRHVSHALHRGEEETVGEEEKKERGREVRVHSIRVSAYMRMTRRVLV
jgi:hypothetical protein